MSIYITNNYSIYHSDKPLVQWTQEEVVVWFENSPDFKKFKDEFKYAGSILAKANMQSIQDRCGDGVVGSALYTTLQELNQGSL